MSTAIRPGRRAIYWIWYLGLSASVFACERAAIPLPREAPPRETTAKAPTPPKPAAPAARRYAVHSRLVAFGDVHGDLEATREALRLAGAIDGEDRWIGGDLVIVQTGDQLDRGDDEPQILALLDRLATEARTAGGAVHVLNGNHELMNVAGDFRYVTEDGFRDYSDPAADELSTVGRAKMFRPGGDLAKSLAERDVVRIVGNTAFVHGGLLPKHVEYGLGRLNREVQAWMRGQGPPPAIVASPDSPVWTRVLSDGQPDPATCAQLESVLSALKVERVVVGHTVQEQGINAACDGRVWRIDTGMAKHYGGTVQVLEIDAVGVRALGGAGPTRP